MGSHSPPAAKAGKASGSAAIAGTINVRMYNVGFGDCFLLTVPTKAGPKRILFDCGSIKAAKDHDMDEVVKEILAACGGGSGPPRIDVVVATHRHKDHVSGFAKDGWNGVSVGEVWMPWTEDPADPRAKEIRDNQAKLAVALQASLKIREMAFPKDAKQEGLGMLLDNALSNEVAMSTLHDGFAGQPLRRFMPAKDQKNITFETDVLPGIKISVLGPSRDPDVIRDMDPPQGKSYVKLGESTLDNGMAPRPFDRKWEIDGVPPVEFSEEDRAKLQQMGDLDPAIASALDKAVNGTSLMLVLKVGSTYLLFPGDAQWGTWQAAMKNPDSNALLRATRFYKVGHHGSHNATPREFVETLMPAKDTVGMCSTGHVDKWPEIPRQPLLDSLADHHMMLVRSDKSPDLYIDLAVPVT